jgi:hypothetical protein
MSFGTAFISCSANAVGIYSASCPNIANNRSFPVVNKPSPSSEKHMSSNPESENIRIEHVDPRSCGTPGRQDIDHYFLQKACTVDELIEEGSRLITAVDLWAISLLTHRLLRKLDLVKPCQYPGFDQALHTTVLVLKSSRAQAAVDPLPKHLVEVTFAAHYFLKVYDLIPDNTPEIGLADDYAVLKRVMARNRTELDDIVHPHMR